LPPPERPDGNLAGCHILYASVRREANGAGWRTDYPWGQRNLLIRLSELTKTRVSRPAGGFPHVWLVRLTDPALFGVPLPDGVRRRTAVAHFGAIRDVHGRIIAAMTHNTDVSNSWELTH
jgi:hypothetical protein